MWHFMFNMTLVTVYLCWRRAPTHHLELLWVALQHQDSVILEPAIGIKDIAVLRCFDFSFIPILFKNQAPVCTLTLWKWTTAE